MAQARGRTRGTWRRSLTALLSAAVVGGVALPATPAAARGAAAQTPATGAAPGAPGAEEQYLPADKSGFGTARSTLSITIVGLPPGIAANVSVTGPSYSTPHLWGSSASASVLPGTYTITAASKSTPIGVCTASPATQSANVTSGQTTTRTVTYSC